MQSVSWIWGISYQARHWTGMITLGGTTTSQPSEWKESGICSNQQTFDRSADFIRKAESEG